MPGKIGSFVFFKGGYPSWMNLFRFYTILIGCKIDELLKLLILFLQTLPLHKCKWWRESGACLDDSRMHQASSSFFFQHPWSMLCSNENDATMFV